MTAATVPAGPPQHTPGAGWARLTDLLGDRMPVITDEDERRTDLLLASAQDPSLWPPDGDTERADR